MRPRENPTITPETTERPYCSGVIPINAHASFNAALDVIGL
jgi:hypothetical protein